jgi:hypothetical protein
MEPAPNSGIREPGDDISTHFPDILAPFPVYALLQLPLHTEAQHLSLLSIVFPNRK